jgi:Immunity protein 58
MIKSTYVLLALLTAAIVACVTLTYLWIDQSVSLSYARQSAETSHNALLGLRVLLEDEWRGQPEAQLLQKLQAAAARMPNAKVIIKREGDVIWFDSMRFNLEQGKLSSIGDR